jgi:hypothetical protein
MGTTALYSIFESKEDAEKCVVIENKYGEADYFMEEWDIVEAT